MSHPTLLDDPGARLGVLTQAPAAAVKAFAETLLDDIGEVEVLRNRTGLVMLPMSDTVQGTPFYLGEALVAEAHVRIAGGEGYGLCLGRDLEQALAVAIVDAAGAAGLAPAPIAQFVAEHAAALAAADDELLRAVEATRVEMETF